MKKKFFLGIFLCLNAISFTQNIDFTDANFKNALLNHNPVIDTNRDGEISKLEAEGIANLIISHKNINNLIGIEYFVNITSLAAAQNEITDIDISKNVDLRQLYIDDNKLESIDISKNVGLWELKIKRNKLESIDISKNVDLRQLEIGANRLTGLDLSNNNKLTIFNCSSNQLTSLDVTNNTKLNEFYCSFNQLTSIDLTKNSRLGKFGCIGNKFISLDFTNNTRLHTLSCGKNPLVNLDLTNIANLTCTNTPLTSINLTNCRSLVHLNLVGNLLTNLDVSNNLQLETLYCGGNPLVNLDVTNNSNLLILSCGLNQLTSLDVSMNTKLNTLVCSNNEIDNLDVSMNTKLNTLVCSKNEIKDLNLFNNTELNNLYCAFNKIEELDARNCMIDQIYFNNNPNLTQVYLTGQEFNIRNLHNNVGYHGCPNLNFLCVDNEYVAHFQNRLSSFYNPGSYIVSSSCDANLNIVYGDVKYDLDANGCNASDIGFSNLKFTLLGATGVTEVFPLNSGAYKAVVYDGDYFMFPFFENPAYFNIDPQPDPTLPPTPISFPQDGSNVKKDFCITPNGIHNDLEVVIIPIEPAVPGFNGRYLISYKNKGTTTQSGNITLDYMQDVLTLVSANPAVTSTATNQLSWGFSNLQPFESREIQVILNINTPTDSPAVNGGDILSYTATVTAASDETPNNNVALLKQTVVNSFDPNDKICLEGNTIEPKDVGKYLHYMIRFENKGTADAINITVKDDIDTTKLDIESFIPLQASHSYTTVINNKKEVEFIFENINLPFDDANNDGYVLFKIKTKEGLVEGDQIDNKAAFILTLTLQ